MLTWLDRARRDVLRVHPRGDPARPEQGVFAIEALDGTPVLDVKPLLRTIDERWRLSAATRA